MGDHHLAGDSSTRINNGTPEKKFRLRAEMLRAISRIKPRDLKPNVSSTAPMISSSRSLWFVGTFFGSPVIPGFSALDVKLEELGLRRSWSLNIFGRVQDRLKQPRFGFPGVFDRAPPPPKTLHWKHAPVSGEYYKLRAMLSWGVLHLALVARRLGPDHPAYFIFSNCTSSLENELITTWLPEASIPAFSIKGEAKKLTDDLRQVLSELIAAPDSKNLVETVWKHSLRDFNVPESDVRLSELASYLKEQERMLEQLTVKQILTEQWKWEDSLDP